MTDPANIVQLRAVRPAPHVVPPAERPHDDRVVDAVNDLLGGLAPGPCTERLVSAVLHAPPIPDGATLDDALAYVIVLGLAEGRGVLDLDDSPSRGPVYAAMAALAVRAGVSP